MSTLPKANSSVAVEYQALKDGTALLNRSDVGLVTVEGEDALDLLNRLTTNDLMDLNTNFAMPSVLTSNKGRIMDLLLVLRMEDHLLVFTSPGAHQKVASHINFYTFTEDVRVHDITTNQSLLTIAGPGSTSLLDKMGVLGVASLRKYETVRAKISDVGVTVARTDFLGLPSYDLLAGATHFRHLWQNLQRNGARPVGQEALTTARVELGVPAYGTELCEAYNPLEALLLDYISFTKGCYVGQEIVTRLNTYKKVQKFLVGLRWHPASKPKLPVRLLFKDKQVGVLTSAAISPINDVGMGLGYVKKAHAKSGNLLDMDSVPGASPVSIIELLQHA